MSGRSHRAFGDSCARVFCAAPEWQSISGAPVPERVLERSESASPGSVSTPGASLIAWALVAVLFALVAARAAEARVFQVPTGGDIQAAVDSASVGDVVFLSAGTFTISHPAGGGDTTRCMVNMKSGITLEGSGIQSSILNVQHQGRGIQCSGVTAAVIEQLTIEWPQALTDGAGILCKNGSSPTLKFCEVLGASNPGILCEGGSNPTIDNCRSGGNTAPKGAGIAIYDSSPQISNCRIDYDNTPNSGEGGGIYITGSSSPTIQTSLMLDDGGSLKGSGLRLVGATAHVTNSWFSGGGGDGGVGISVEGASAQLFLVHCQINDNHTFAVTTQGGTILLEGGTALIDSCLIDNNDVADYPGTGSKWGGSIQVNGCSATIRQCTIADNLGTYGGHGGVVYSGQNSPPVQKSIIVGSSGYPVECIPGTGAGHAVVSCCDFIFNASGNTFCGDDGGNNFSADPDFCYATFEDYELHPGSPCASHCGGLIGSQIVSPICAPTSVNDSKGAGTDLAVQAVPNPFHPPVRLSYRVPDRGWVSLRILDAAGRLVRVVAEGQSAAGEFSASWDGRDDRGLQVPAGLYFVSQSMEGSRSVLRIVLLRH